MKYQVKPSNKFLRDVKPIEKRHRDLDEPRLEQFVSEMFWESIPEEVPSQEEAEIFEKYNAGVEEYQGIYSVDEI